MAHPNMTDNNSNNSTQTMQREKAKAEVGSGSQREQSGIDKDRQDKSAIGGQSKSDETAKDKNTCDFDKNSSSQATGLR